MDTQLTPLQQLNKQLENTTDKNEIEKLNNLITIEQTTPDHVGKLSPFRDYVNIKSGGNTIGLNTFGLSDYVWYPESILTKSRDDYFETLRLNKESLNDDGDQGIIDGVSMDDLKDPIGVVNKTMDFIETSVGGVIDSVGGLFKKSDKIDKKTIDENNLIKIIEKTPHIILYEFKPNSAIGEITGAFSGAFKQFDSFFADKTEGKPSLLDNIKHIFSKDGIMDILKDVMGKDIESTVFTSSYGKVVDIPNFFYMNLIGGYYTGQYTLPFFEQNDYLHGMGDQGWESKSLKQRMLPGGLSGMMDNLSSLASSFDIASKPKWTMDGSGPAGDEITFELNLFNHNHESLMSNIRMLHSLVAGNMWTQSVFLQLSPSLYDIEIPGRYRYFFCKADIKVEFLGKQRIPTKKFKNELSSLVAFDNLVDEVSYNYNFNEDSFKFIPDAYKLIIKFTSLIPNNFNSYLNYLIKGEDNISVGNAISSSGNAMLQGITNALTKRTKDVENKQAILDAENGVASVTTTT